MKIHPAKIVIGLTGGFGTGKSTVARFFEKLGAHVIDADALAHEALDFKNSKFRKISAMFPEALSADKKSIDRKMLADLIFADSGKRCELEAIIHPYVLERIIDEVADAKADIVIVEVPLLFETGMDQYCDYNIVINASDDAVVSRLRHRGFSLKEVRERGAAQMPVENKLKRADLIIDNSKNLNETEQIVTDAWEKVRHLSKGAV